MAQTRRSTLTPAERQRRSRRHKAGDHSLCDPGRGCGRPQPAPEPSPSLEPTRPLVAQSFGPRGTQLWDEMSGAQLGPSHRVLLVEACRLADRLDRLDGMLSGAEWFTERHDDDERLVVVVDALLAEARQHASALRAIVAQLEPRPKAIAPAQRKGGGSGLGDFAAKFEARRSQIPAG